MTIYTNSHSYKIFSAIIINTRALVLLFTDACVHRTEKIYCMWEKKRVHSYCGAQSKHEASI